MKKFLKATFFCIIIFLLIIGTNIYAFSGTATMTEYTEEYKKYLSLSEEDKQNVLEPNPYNAIYNNNSQVSGIYNVFSSMNTLKNSLDSSYNLKDYIPNNVKVRDQASTNFCWAYATLGSAESALGFLDYKNGSTNTIYDFSERHLAYGSRRNAFINNQINEYGATKDIKSGGNFYEAQTYLSNGMGAIKEAEMPFENNMNNIDISKIKNKTVTTTLYDTVWFETTETTDTVALMSKMKQYISTYGGIYAGVHGASLFSDAYNNSTGALYCNDPDTFLADHAVTIIGWDDNYSRENFNEEIRPIKNGAWIVKNSWGENVSYTLEEIKDQMYEANKDFFNGVNINSPQNIPDEFIEEYYKSLYGEDKVSISNGNITITIGNDGYMYVSYEDVNIYDSLSAVQKISATKDYDNIYQHDELGSGVSMYFTGQKKMYIANKFNRNDEIGEEVLDKISLFTLQEVKCEVYVNPDSNDLSKVQKVELKVGDSITLEPGYHMIELENPITLTGESFAIAASIEAQDGVAYIMIENKNADQNVEYNINESFYTDEDGFQSGSWNDWNITLQEELHGNVSLKAFTRNGIPIIILNNIEITKAPNKTNYVEGENFSSEGMVVEASYSDLSTKTISDYEIIDGENLYAGQTEVTISYTEGGVTKTAKQKITVEAKETEQEINKIEILKLPTKLEYAMNDNELDLAGGIIKVTYTDGTTDEINMESSEVSAIGFNSGVPGKQTITINYKEFTTTFEIQVLNNREPVLSSLENIKTKLESFNVYTYKEMDETDYIEMQLEISNVSELDENTNYTYYYYISSEEDKDNIENWIKINSGIEKNEDGTYYINFLADTRELQNLAELINAEKGYLYIKEEAEIDGNVLEQTKVSEIEVIGATATYYVDNEEVIDPGTSDDTNSNLDDEHNNGSDVITDNTIAEGKIPQTGIISVGIIIFVIIGISIVSYIRYKNIDK